MRQRLLLVTALVGTACGCGDAGPSFKSNCTAQPPSADALVPAQRNGDGSVILPDGRKISPAGRAPDHRRLPAAAARAAAGQRALRRRHRRRLRRRAPAHRRHAGDRRRHRDRLERRLSALDRRRQVAGAVLRPGADRDGSEALRLRRRARSARRQRARSVQALQHHRGLRHRRLAAAAHASRAEIHLMFAGAASPQARLPSGLALSADEQHALRRLPARRHARRSSTSQPGATQYTEIGRTHAARHRPLRRGGRRGVAHRVRVAVGRPFVSVGTFVDGVVPVDVTNPTAPCGGRRSIAHRQVARAG